MEEEFVEDVPREAVDVAKRCIVLCAVIGAGHDVDRGELIEWLEREGLWDVVSPKEAEFLHAATPTSKQMINAKWRAEALCPLLWALQKLPAMPAATELVNVGAIQDLMPDVFASTFEFVTSAALRDLGEIHTVLEETFQAHWSVRDAQINDRPVPDGLNPGVVYERHYALNWLTGYEGSEWDDVATDT